MTLMHSPHGDFEVREHPDVPANKPHVIGCVSRRTSLPSFLTRFFTLGARWSHMGCVDVERGVVIEAKVWSGVVATPISEWIADYPSCEFFRTECPRPDLALAHWRSRLLQKIRYDFKGAVATVWRLRKLQDPKRDFCNELWEEGLHAGGRRRLRLPGMAYPPMDSWMWL